MNLDLLEKISLPNTCKATWFSQTSKADALVPSDAGHPWILKLYNIAEPKTDPHYHKIRTQTFVFLEGQTTLHLGQIQERVRAGQIVTIPPHLAHTLEQTDPVRFMVIDWPNLDYPEDHYENIGEAPNTNQAFITPFPVKESFLNESYSVPQDSLDLQDLPPSAYQKRLEYPTHVVYEMCADPNHKWSLAIIDVNDVVPHFHEKGTEHFIVLSGQLKIEIQGVTHILAPGQSAHIAPGQGHHLKSTTAQSARLLCVNFPAFEPSDFHPFEQR
jgi:mannose-6-phosphate isomerase-like protein (cupin superfamily)